MVTPGDDLARQRFATELDRNFSVVASAGSGKTTAITQRVLSIAHSNDAREILPRLVVVTFANRAADEMQQRTRQLLLEENLIPEVQAAFSRAFFGTIHAFCMKLLTDFGHYLGLPAPLELSNEDDELWREFAQGYTRIGNSLGKDDRAKLLRLVQARDLMELGRRAGSAVLPAPELSSCPKPDFAELRGQIDRGGRDTISRSLEELADWEERYAGDWEFLRWPVCFTAANSKFTLFWREKFAPLRKWISEAALGVAAEVQRAYRDFRLERGFVTYADQIALARELLQHPIAGQRIREEGFRVILDEAQDTEPAQFSVLLEAARPPQAASDWMESHTNPPPPGHFCMVGDFQQSIYRDPSDLNYYRAVHKALIAHGGGEELEFSVTFRLDEKQLAFVNETFREILNEQGDQVRFVELRPRPQILPGSVIRVPLAKSLLPEGKKLKDYQKARIEAEYLAAWIQSAGLTKLSADSWRDVAILCPRKAWLQTMAAALRRVDLPVSIQSERDVKGDSPAYAWLTALLAIMSNPLNAYEIVGVLREIFGASDHDLAVFSEGHNERFRIDEVLPVAGKISSHLRKLAEVRARTENLALFDAVTLIVTETQLRERLLTLPLMEFGDLAREIDALLAQAAEMERGGTILPEFTRHLRDDFTTARTVRFSADDNAIQLITSHKAKGSEWQAVILPFLARDMRAPTPPYPHFVKSPKTGELILALNGDDKSPDLKEAMELAEQQKLDRLLYVATTRARHTLVLVLDQEIFSSADGNLPRTAQLRRLLRAADCYSGEFDQHSDTIDQIPEVPARPPSVLEKREAGPEPLSSAERLRAVTNAAKSIRKFTPSALDADIPDDVRVRSRLDNLATLYGRWWHRFFERLDWKGGAEPAQKLFEEQLPLSPDPDEATKDWNASRENLFNDASIADFLRRSGTQFHHEYPFSWRRNDAGVVEGQIDSLMIDRESGRCLLLDWKTNKISLGEADAFRARYCPQLAAYWKAVGEITKLEVSAALFSTALGRLLPYATEELRAEWERLENLPPIQLASELRPDPADDC